MENKGCITCRKCEQVRINFYCGRTRLTQKQLYKPGFCSKYEPREQAKAKPMTNEEWFDTLTTKGKAEIIAQLSSYGGNVEAILNWLKEVHKE